MIKLLKSACIALILINAPVLHAGWSWHNPLPAGNTLNAVACNEDDLFVMAGEGGLLLEYNSGIFDSPDFNTFQRVHDLELTETGGIAVCERADVLLRTPDGWVVDRPASSASFYGAAALPNGDYFVCGDGGQIHRYSNGVWEQMSSNTSSTLKDIDMFSEDRGWAVGLFSTVRVWNGTAWQYYSSGITRFLRSVSGASADCAWAVGDIGAIVRWTGTDFQNETWGENVSLYDVHAVDCDEAWAVGDNGTVLHRTSGAWSSYTHPSLPVDINYRGIAYNGSDDIMIVGSSGVIFHFDGSQWTPLKTDSLSGMHITDLHKDPMTGYMLLSGERGKIYEFDGSSFMTQMTGTTSDIFMLTMDLDGDLWAGGSNGLLLQNTGLGWNQFSTGDPDTIMDMDFLPAGDIWTAGGSDDGSCVSWTVLHYDGSDWTQYGESGS